ncbi:hypothetical protein N0V82_009416 [Gnomoniopsis sp. IMI 355080]|nr:hypothetical protein N0V82_009416 [Gnomoniopsis sp. IMI 355080]
MALPGWLKIWYKRPEWKDIRDYTRQLNDESLIPRHRPSSPSPPLATAIPARLQLERVLENKTCSPMSLHDFYLYLKYIEHSSENLEFWLWYKNYDANYPSAFRESEDSDIENIRPLSKAYIPGSEASGSSTAAVSHKDSIASITERIVHLESPCLQKARAGPAWKRTLARWLPGHDHSTTCGDGFCRLDLDRDDAQDIERAASPISLSRSVKRANVPAETKAELRAELDAAVATFLLPGAEKDLNISHSLRQRVLRRVEKSTDPRHLKPVADHILEVMRNCSHRNFINVGVGTGTYETICVSNVLGVLNILAGLVFMFVQAFSPHIGSHTRYTVLYAMPLWAMGTTLLLVGTQGMCFVMLTQSKRQALPWERFAQEDAAEPGARAGGGGGGGGWFATQKRFLSRTVAIDKQKFRVDDKYLRRLQRMILMQCVAGGVLASCVGALIFIFLPIWKETR